MRYLLTVLCIAGLLTFSNLAEAVKRSAVKFGPGDKHTGYLVRPDGKGPFPGLVVIHEWWGLNSNVRDEASRLAKAGYVALAVDLFGKSTADPQEARKQTQGLDQKAATAELLAAANYLRSLPYVPDGRVGSIGWCFGGKQSLELAMADPKLAAAVIYYGQPVTDPKQLSAIKARLLGIFGEADGSIPVAKVTEFRRALSRAGVKHQVHTYPGAGHAFANPTRGDAYKPEAAADAWKKTLAFLRATLGPPGS